MPNHLIKRRTLLKSAVVGAAAIPFADWFAEKVEAQAATFTRRNIYALAPAGPEIQALRNGVAAMKSRPASDPTSWLYQANIHGFPSGARQTAWGTCQHGSFFFLPWHRMYVYFFERILRKSSGVANFALPYWNYSNPAQAALPVVCRQPANASNPLFVSQRRPVINAGISIPTQFTEFSDAFADTTFTSPTGSGNGFGGQFVSAATHFGAPHGKLESQPHDIMHVIVGGNGGWMTDPNLAARDIIFWIHHCNIDRLWERWLELEGGRSNPTNIPNWMNQRFQFFDEDGNLVQMSASQVLDVVQQLDYRYDDAPFGRGSLLAAAPPRDTRARLFARSSSSGSSTLAASAAQEQPIPLNKGKHTLKLDLSITSRARPMAFAPGASSSQERVILSIEGIMYTKPQSVYYEVYLNLPEGTDPDPRSPYYAGLLPIFALGKHAHGDDDAAPADVPPGRRTIDITNIVQKQMEMGIWGGDAPSVSLIAGSLDENMTERSVSVEDSIQITGIRIIRE